MSDELIFYTNPMSRGRIVRWMLEEIGAPYQTVLLDYDGSMKAPEYLAINPMGKVPAIKHGDRVVSECAAICLYLADAFPKASLAPALADRADYYRWILFGAGPVESAFSNKAAGFEPGANQQRMFGYGNFNLAMDCIEKAVTGKQYIAAGRFTAADVYVGSLLAFMMDTKMLETRSTFVSYVEFLKTRPAYRRAQEIDDPLTQSAPRG